jgi:hypothetical protein
MIYKGPYTPQRQNTGKHHGDLETMIHAGADASRLAKSPESGELYEKRIQMMKRGQSGAQSCCSSAP